MKIANRIFKPFEALLSTWWYKLSSLGLNAQFGPFLSQMAALICAISILVGCGTVKYLPQEEKTRTEYRDSLVMKIDTVYVPVPVESVRDFGRLTDTLFLETSVAASWAVADTNNLLVIGELKNKEINLEKEIIYKEHVVYKDSIRIEKEPYPVIEEKIVKTYPKLFWISLSINLLVIIFLIIKIVMKLKK